MQIRAREDDADTPNGSTMQPTSRAALRWGILCALFCVVAVFVRGVRWDETYEYARMLSGQIPYPEGHPNLRYLQAAPSFQTYSATGLVSLGMGPLVLCGLRNILFLLATVMPVYLLTQHLSRRPLWAVAATLLVLQNILIDFDGSYPTSVWPELYSNGHIGSAYAVLTLYAVVAGRVRMAAALFAFMPAIHIGQFPPLLGLFPIYLIWAVRSGRVSTLKKALPALLVSAAALAVFYLYQSSFAQPPPTEGPYFSTEDYTEIWRSYTQYHDPHRQFPPGNGHVILVGALLLTALGAWRLSDSRQRIACAWLLAYLTILGATVWGIMLVHGIVGADIPFLLIVWMPYRLINHVPPICIAVVVALIARTPYQGSLILAAALVFGAAKPLLSSLIAARFYEPYLSGGEIVFFGLYGMALVNVLSNEIPSFRAARPILAGASITALALYHQFGGLCMALGATGYFALQAINSRRHLDSPRATIALAVACVLVTATLLYHEAQGRRSLPISDFDKRLVAYFDKHPQPMKPLLTRPDEFYMQSRVERPVVVEVTTPSLMTYLPVIAPVIDAMYMDLYGITFSASTASAKIDGLSWEQRWERRSLAKWRILADKYGFKHVVAPPNVVLKLQKVFGDATNTLYELPR